MRNILKEMVLTEVGRELLIKYDTYHEFLKLKEEMIDMYAWLLDIEEEYPDSKSIRMKELEYIRKGVLADIKYLMNRAYNMFDRAVMDEVCDTENRICIIDCFACSDFSYLERN